MSTFTDQWCADLNVVLDQHDMGTVPEFTVALNLTVEYPLSRPKKGWCVLSQARLNVGTGHLSDADGEMIGPGDAIMALLRARTADEIWSVLGPGTVKVGGNFAKLLVFQDGMLRRATPEFADRVKKLQAA